MKSPSDLEKEAQRAAVKAKTLRTAITQAGLAAAKLKIAEDAETKATELETEAKAPANAAQNADPAGRALESEAKSEAAAAARSEARRLRSEAEEAQMEAEVLYKAAHSDSAASKVATAFTNLGTYILLAVATMVGVLIWAVTRQSTLLDKLSQTEAARGLVTFLITASAVGIAFMLIYHAFSEFSNSENFRMAREIFMSLIGILGTIVGFYFGAAGSEDKSRVGLEVAPITQEGEILKSSLRGGDAPYKWTLTPAPETGLTEQQGETNTDGELTISVKGAKDGGVTLSVEDEDDMKVSRTHKVKAATP